MHLSISLQNVVLPLFSLCFGAQHLFSIPSPNETGRMSANRIFSSGALPTVAFAVLSCCLFACLFIYCLTREDVDAACDGTCTMGTAAQQSCYWSGRIRRKKLKEQKKHTHTKHSTQRVSAEFSLLATEWKCVSGPGCQRFILLLLCRLRVPTL